MEVESEGGNEGPIHHVLILYFTFLALLNSTDLRTKGLGGSQLFRMLSGQSHVLPQPRLNICFSFQAP